MGGDLSFFALLEERHKSLGHRLCVGIDPRIKGLDGFLAQQCQALGPAAFIEKQSRLILERCQNRVGSVKFQSAYFEALGDDGFRILRDLFAAAKNLGLQTIYDAKRGDIGSTLEAYGDAAFEFLDADAVTFAPYMGLETLNVWNGWLNQGKGVYVVVRSSNPEGQLNQSAKVAGRGTIAESLLHAVRAWNQQKGDQLGCVWGVQNVAELPPHDDLPPLLMPGVGAQGATVDEKLQRVLSIQSQSIVPISRGISHSRESTAPANWSEYEQSLDNALENYVNLLKSPEVHGRF